LLQHFAAFLCKSGARALDKSLIKLLTKRSCLDGVQGVECSNHFAPTKFDYSGAAGKATVPNPSASGELRFHGPL
jgi:hypothetical protein